MRPGQALSHLGAVRRAYAGAADLKAGHSLSRVDVVLFCLLEQGWCSNGVLYEDPGHARRSEVACCWRVIPHNKACYLLVWQRLELGMHTGKQNVANREIAGDHIEAGIA